MCKCLGEDNERSPSIGDVIVLLTGDICFGMASDREAGLFVFFMFLYWAGNRSSWRLSWFAAQRDGKADSVSLLTWKKQLGASLSSQPHQTICHWTY